MDTPVCDFGAPSHDFTLADPMGVEHRFQDHLANSDAILLAFICNHCPYVKAVAARLAADARSLMDEGVAVLGIMSNDFVSYPDDAPEYMAQFAKMYGFPFPYLVDEDQSVARAYGAVCTPDFFGYNKDAQLQYRGRIDDARMGDATNRAPELLTAMRQIAKTDEGPANQMPSMGCSIKWR